MEQKFINFLQVTKMTDYNNNAKELTNLLDIMVNSADYKNNDSLTHKRIKTLNNFLYDYVNWLYYEFDYISMSDNFELQCKRMEIMKNYIKFRKWI